MPSGRVSGINRSGNHSRGSENASLVSKVDVTRVLVMRTIVNTEGYEGEVMLNKVQRARDARNDRSLYREVGLCPCGCETLAGKNQCERCIKRMSKFYFRRKANGLCVECCAPVDSKVRCVQCLEVRENKRLVQEYEITLAAYREMAAKQGNKCAICGNRETRGKRKLAIDHDHETGQIRGLLCQGCNVSLGFLSLRDLYSAIAYLEKRKGGSNAQ